jgi:thymidylate synthase
MHRKFATLDQLYRSTLEEIHHRFEFRNSPRGNAEREIIGYCARIEDPTARFCQSPRRRQNIVFNYAEALWYLSGRNDLEFIAWYAPSIARYSADGRTLPGTGYGARLLHFGANGMNQIERAFDILARDDSDSKRVFLQIFDANEDIYRRSIDVSCTLGLQLLRRENKLHMVAFLRANDAYLGLLSDVFSFTFLQEYFASVLGCEIGAYSHQVGSIHIYDCNQSNVEELLRTVENPVSTSAAPRMPAGCSPELIRRVLGFEAQIRSSAVSFEFLERLDLDDYWRDILMLFRIYRAILAGEPVPEDVVLGLHPLHRDYLINRWSDSISLQPQAVSA